MFTPFATSEDVRDVLRKFESCEFGPGEFHHREHVTVALCYLLESTEDEACSRMRTGLSNFLKRHGSLNAYHETITVFWIKIVRQLLEQTDRSRPLVEVTNSVVSACSDLRLINDYFSAERITSDDARKNWIEPDLKPLEF